MCLGIPGQVVEITDPAAMMGMVTVAGVKRLANLACVVDAEHPIESCVGDWVIVHVGFAMSRIDPEEAQRSLAVLAELGDITEAREAMRLSGREGA
jgi:hydrogenase expression/formation protein HypC